METVGKHVCPQTLSLTGRFGEPHTDNYFETVATTLESAVP